MTGLPQADKLLARLELLGQLVDEDGQRLPGDLANRARQTADSAQGRLGQGTSHTVIALAGATGSGKSSLFNAITNSELARTGVTRPTTSQARAAVFGDVEAHGLLDWLGVQQRDHVEVPGVNGLVLLDLPDHDSTAAAHRAEAERLVAVVDVLCWVVDPQKYADAALHEDFIQRYAGHGAVTLVLLNQADTLRADELSACVSHLQRLLAEDGLVGVRVVAVSARSGAGIPEVRREFSARADERRAAVSRLEADLDWLAADLAVAVGETAPGEVSAPARDRLVEAAATVAGVDAVSDAAAGSYRLQASGVAGWPVTRWISKLKPDPLRRLGINRSPDGPGSGGLSGSVTRRTSLPAARAADVGELAAAGRDLVSACTREVPDAWVARMDSVVRSAMDPLPDRLDRAMATPPGLRRPLWWLFAGTLQRLVTLAALIGGLWLATLAVLGWLRLPDPPLPHVGVLPLPTVLGIGGLVAGLLIAAVARGGANFGSRRYSQRVRDSLRSDVAKVVQTEVIQPANEELRAMRRTAERVRIFSR